MAQLTPIRPISKGSRGAERAGKEPEEASAAHEASGWKDRLQERLADVMEGHEFRTSYAILMQMCCRRIRHATNRYCPTTVYLTLARRWCRSSTSATNLAAEGAERKILHRASSGLKEEILLAHQNKGFEHSLTLLFLSRAIRSLTLAFDFHTLALPVWNLWEVGGAQTSDGS